LIIAGAALLFSSLPRPTSSRPTPPDHGPNTTPVAGGRALLVGVTRYDHLPRAEWWREGPANDVRRFREILTAYYGFPPQEVVSLTEDEEAAERRPTRANIEREFRSLA